MSFNLTVHIQNGEQTLLQQQFTNWERGPDTLMSWKVWWYLNRRGKATSGRWRLSSMDVSRSMCHDWGSYMGWVNMGQAVIIEYTNSSRIRIWFWCIWKILSRAWRVSRFWQCGRYWNVCYGSSTRSLLIGSLLIICTGNCLFELSRCNSRNDSLPQDGPMVFCHGLNSHVLFLGHGLILKER